MVDDQGKEMNNRRRLVVALGTTALSGSFGSFAQPQTSKVARVGLLESSSSSADQRAALIAGLRELGLVESKNITIEYRWAEGQYERLPALAAELVQMNVDVILAGGTPAVQAAKQATATIPIVMLRVGDPVGSGFVASLSRPGRNITGLSNILADVASKYVELLRVAVPELSRVIVLANPSNPIHHDYLERVQTTAKTNRVSASPAEASTASEIDAAFRAMKHER